MYVLLLLLQTILAAIHACPTCCVCSDDGIVNCISAYLQQIPPNIPTDTRILNLSNNRISSLTATSLNELYQLEELHLTSNFISRIDRTAFRNNVKLRLLNLKNNYLLGLPETLLDNNHQLVQIDVRNNTHLNVIPYDLVQHIYTLKSVIADNANCDDCSMATWFEHKNYFTENNIEMDIICYYPSVLRGTKLRDLPYDTFETCYEGKACSRGLVSCHDGLDCIKAEYWCDDNWDCADGSDELLCPDNSIREECSDSQFQCTNGECVPNEWVCDSADDCGDNSDEDNCDFVSDNASMCDIGYFGCRNSRCVERSAICDGLNDCGDWSDESKLMCGDVTVNKLCPPGQFMCEGSGCIEHVLLCDGVIHCSDASDESNCAGNCSTGLVECDGRCVEEAWRCDGRPDCTDGEDEEYCLYECEENEVPCGRGGCVACSFVCDGYRDCLDGSDESDCAVCNTTLCLESTKKESSTMIIIATSASACISIACIILYLFVYREGRKQDAGSQHPTAMQPPSYTDLDFIPGQVIPATPPPRYKSEPDVRLDGQILIESEEECDSDEAL